jgi:hypothetical protein
MVKNPKTGKVFCSEKCWLRGGQTNQTPTPQPSQSGAPNWEDIRAQKSEGQAKGAAFNKAVDLVIAMYTKGDVELQDIMQSVRNTFAEFTKINKTNGVKKESPQSVDVDAMDIPF